MSGAKSATRGNFHASSVMVTRPPQSSKVAALPGFEAIAEVTFPPLIGLVEMTHLHFVGFRMLCKPVAKSEVAIETHEFSQINVGNTRVASNDQHVLVVIRS